MIYSSLLSTDRRFFYRDGTVLPSLWPSQWRCRSVKRTGPLCLNRTSPTRPLCATLTATSGWTERTVQTIKTLVSDALSWCQLFLPLALYAGFALLFRPVFARCVPPSPYVHQHHAVYASVSSSTNRHQHSWTEIMQYRFQKIMSMQMFGKLCAVVLAATPIVVFGGIGYKLVTGRKLNAALFKAYSVMSAIPGASAVEADNSAGLFLCSLIFFAGTFTVAVTLGIICKDVSTAVDTVRNGNYQIIEEGHMVILNINERLRPVLSQIAEVCKERGSFRCPIVILDDKAKEELDTIVSHAAEGLELNILTRHGCTHDIADLKRVAAGKAKCVIWLEPEDDEISVAARRAAAIATLKALGSGDDRPVRVIVQTSQDSAKSKKQLTDVSVAFRYPPLKETNKLRVVEVYEEENLDRFLAQCALQPHLSGILSDIFQQNEGKEFYITAKTDFGGQTYGSARRHFYKAVVCGIYSPGPKTGRLHGSVRLNPPDDTVLRNDDELVVLCSDLWHAEPESTPLPSPSPWTENVERHHSACCPENVVVLCFGEEDFADSGLVDAIGRFASTSTRVTVVANSIVERQGTNGRCHLSYIEGNPASYRTLQQLKRKKIDSVVLAGLEDLPPKVADAQLLSTLIQIQEMANECWEDKTGFNVVSPVNFSETQLVAKHLIEEGNRTLQVPMHLDMILPKNLSSGVLVQVAGYPQLDLVFKELLCAAGSEIYIRNMDAFQLVGRGPVKCYEVADIARRHNETFLGVLKKDNTFITAPDAFSEREYAADEKLVVLAESMHPEKLSED